MRVECVCVCGVWMCQNGKQVQNATVCTEKLKKYTGNMYVYIVINYVYVYRTITTVHLIVRMHIYLFSVKYFSPFQSLGFFKKSYPSVNIFPFLFGEWKMYASVSHIFCLSSCPFAQEVSNVFSVADIHLY